MGLTGHQIASTALVVVAFALFIPVFGDLAAGFSHKGWVYAPYFQTILNHLDILIAIGVVIFLGVIVREY